jgi:hypothetical protein
MITSILATIKFGACPVTAPFEIIEREAEFYVLLADHGQEWILLPLTAQNIEKIPASSLPYQHFHKGALDAKNAIIVPKHQRR